MTQGAALLIGQISTPHGIRGLVKARLYVSTPQALLEAPVFDETGYTHYKVLACVPMQEQFLLTIEGIKDRTQAEKLKGKSLYMDRAFLTEPEEDEFFQQDLIGLNAMTPDKDPIGEILTIHNFGAGDIIELKLNDGKKLMAPFTKAYVLEVNLEQHYVVLDPSYKEWL